MTKGTASHFKVRPRVFMNLFIISGLLLVACELALPTSTYAQMPEKVRTLTGQFISEANCPISVTQARADLDLDPFDQPLDARVYVTYKNISNSPIDAVNFRIRLADAAGKPLGTFRGPDSFNLAAKQERSTKWRQERVNPLATALQLRVLQVKYADGTAWESEKLKELNNTQAPGEAAPTDNSAGSAETPAETQPDKNSSL